MEYKVFETELVRELMEMNPEAEVVLEDVLQNNGVERTALLILQEKNCCVPVIYLSPIYEYFCRNELTVRESAEYTMNLYRRIQEQLNQESRIDQDLTDFEKVREHLTIKMVNQEKNRKLLENVVSIPFLNLSGMFYVADSLQSMMAGVKVTRFLAELWGVDVEMLRETALDNLASSGEFQMREICEVLSEFSEYRIRRDERITTDLYVITDVSRTNGPAVLLLPQILDRMAEKLDDDLLILPSSVHELIVLKAAEVDGGDMARIVREINASVVSAGDFLADCVYRYSRERSEVTIVA